MLKIPIHSFVFNFFLYIFAKKIRMARKKKKDIDFEPSEYQKAIFEYIEKGNGHLVVEAAAGSGKTYTIVKSLNYIPSDKRILMSAFNTDIVNELKKKTKGVDNVDVRTLHSLGLMFLRTNHPRKEIEIDAYKYESHIKNYISNYTSINVHRLNVKEYYRYLDNIKKYVDFGRYYLCQTIRDLDFIEQRYGIDTMADEKEVAIGVMEWGKNNISTVDYTDMVWLPNVLFLKPIGLLYDFIMVDECQDMNKAERELILKCFKMGTRLISVGDSQQMLYSFAGGDPDSFNALKSIPNTVCLPLSISYRCAKNIVNFAKKIVPSIEANNDGREGEILENVSLDKVKDGDMILCRNNAPLLQVYNSFLKMGRKAYIRGKDIGNNLKKVVKGTKQKSLNVNCREDGVFVRLYDDLFVLRNKMIENLGIDEASVMKSPPILNKLDIIKALEILSEGINTTDELLEKIESIFSKNNKDEGVALSTIHKAKGLEADNVYIVCKSLMPSKCATMDWEIKQEYNLMYVAYTRAKNKLGFIDEKDFDDFDYVSSNNTKELKIKEELVNKVLNKTTKVIINEETAKVIIMKAKNLNKAVTVKKKVELESSIGKTKLNSFSDILKNKRKKKQLYD